MTVPDLIERLQQLPGNNSLRPVVIEKAKRVRQFEAQTEYEIVAVELADMCVKVLIRQRS